MMMMMVMMMHILFSPMQRLQHHSGHGTDEVCRENPAPPLHGGEHHRQHALKLCANVPCQQGYQNIVTAFRLAKTPSNQNSRTICSTRRNLRILSWSRSRLQSAMRSTNGTKKQNSTWFVGGVSALKIWIFIDTLHLIRYNDMEYSSNLC